MAYNAEIQGAVGCQFLSLFTFRMSIFHGREFWQLAKVESAINFRK